MTTHRVVGCGLRAASLLAVVCLAAMPAGEAGATIYVYDNASSGAVPQSNASDDNLPTSCTGGNAVSRTFVVPDVFTVATVSVGVNVSHPRRGDLNVVLEAPSGLRRTILTAVAGDTSDNFDVLISSNAEIQSTDDGDADPVGVPYFHRVLVDPSDDELPDFTGQAAAGTWRVYVCDDNTSTTGGAASTGTLNRARLVLTSAATQTNACATRATYEWGTNGTADFTSATFNDITITETATNDVFGNGSPFGTCATETNTRGCTTHPAGADSGFYHRRMVITTDEGGAMLATFGFDPPVRDLTWAHLDVDQQTSPGWEDAVRIEPRDPSGNLLPYDATPVDPGEIDQHGDIFIGDLPNKTENEPEGNLEYFVAGPVATITVEYFPSDEPGSFASQFVGLGDAFACAYDFGDAPDSYSTSLAGGARHVLGNRLLYLGTVNPDGEADGQPTTAATGDGGDEEGVAAFPPANLVPGATYTVPVRVTNLSGQAATLCGWVDFDLDGPPGDGTFEADEGACVGVPASGSNAACTSLGGGGFTCDVAFTVPADFVYVASEATYARFRVANQALTVAATNGRAESGEVEDYRIAAGTLPVTLAAFAAQPGGHVAWSTASETGNAGFRLLGRSGGGEWRLLDSQPSAVVDSGLPQEYAARVDLVDVAELALVDVDVRGEERWHGPFEIGQQYGLRPELRSLDWAEIKRRTGVATPLERVAQAAEPVADGVRRRAGEARKAQAERPEARLLVHEAGIHRVTHEQLLAAGVDLSGVPARFVALRDGGEAVPREIGGGLLFGPGSWIEFVFAPRLTLESPVDVLELAVDPGRAESPRTLGRLPARPGATAVGRRLDVHAPDVGYSFASPLADPWFDARLLAWGGPASVVRGFDLPDLAAGPVTLRLDLWGGTDWPGGGPDHHVEVLLNGSLLASERFDGIAAWSRTFDVADVVRESSNELVVHLPRDTGFAFDIVHLDRFEVDYPRRTVALAGRWQGTVSGGRGFSVDGFAPEAPVVGWLAAGRRVWRAETTGPSVAVPVSGHATWLAEEGALLAPGIEPGIPAAAKRSRADYLVISHPAFVDGLAPLLALQQARGLRTEVVTTEEIYAAYSDHAADADALRAFVADSHRRGRLRYVLLVGTASYDPWDRLGLGSVSFVPTHYGAIAPPTVNHSPTDELIADVDGDEVPDVALGRLPVRTPEELAALLDKLYAWQARPEHRSALLVAGRSDSGRAIAELNEGLAASLGGWDAGTAAADDLGVAATRQAVLAAFGAQAPSLVSFVGHTSYGIWDFQQILRWQDAAAFGNRGRPALVTQWGCWTSYFASPEVETLSDHLLVTPEVGAVATVGAATMTRSESHQRLGELFFAAVGEGSPTVGEALLAAKRRLAAEDRPLDAILGMVLLGDPAMPVAP